MFQGRFVDNSRKVKSLKSIEFALENPQEHESKLTKKSRILAVVAWIGFFISFLLYFQKLRGLYLPAIASFSGILYGLSMYLDSTIKQWPLVAKHVDIDSIKKEISEIET
jgi:hypothetical protein